MNRYMLAGQLANYHGQAVNPLYLSWWVGCVLERCGCCC